MNAFTPTARARVRRRPHRAAYDEAAVYAVLDAGVLGHLAYVIDGQPYVTPTSYWRDGRRVYWHAAAASRMAEATGSGAPICLTVSFLDGLVVGRSGFIHSANYRSAMCFGRGRLITDLEGRRAATNAFIERLYPGRTASLRPASEAELKQIAVVEMTIEEASAKVRDGGVTDIAPDAGWEAWCGVLPVETRLGAPLRQAGMGIDAAPTPDLVHLAAGARLDAALTAAAYCGVPVSA